MGIPRVSLQKTLVGFAVAVAVGLVAYAGLLRVGWLDSPDSRVTREIVWTIGNPEDLYNFGVVVPGRVYRSAQPDERFIRHVYDRYGVRRVISLNGDQEYQAIAEELGMTVDVYHWKPFQVPENSEVTRVLDAMDGETPVLVHCKFGRDRTGYAVGAYRVWRQGWPVDRALEELDRFGHTPEEDSWIDVTLSFYPFEPQ